MTVYFRLYLFFLLFNSSNLLAQFKFSGQVNAPFLDSKAYLILVDDYKKGDLFLTDQIIQETSIDSLGRFLFSGNFLSKQNKFYKIHIDQCNNEITDYKHLLNDCLNSNSIIFIANNSDSIFFPLNNFEQMFCSLEYSRIQNISIQKIDSVQEVLLYHLQDSKSEAQRKILFTDFIKKIQDFSISLEEPLVELYAYQLYASRNSFSRELYMKDLSKSTYYNELLGRLNENYPSSNYTAQFESDLQLDNYQFKTKKSNLIIGILVVLLLILTGILFILIFEKRKKKRIVDYNKILSPQEQKIFELIHKGLANKEIAAELFISLSTVKTHINNIYAKLKIKSRKEIDSFF